MDVTALREKTESQNTYTSSLPQILEALERLQRDAIDNVPSNVYVYDLVDGCILHSTKSIVEILGYKTGDLEAVEGYNVADLIHPDDLCRFSHHLPSLATLGSEEVVTLEYRMRGADKTYHWLRSQETMLVQADEGYPLQVLGTVQDITTYKNNKQLGAAFGQLVEDLPQMVMITDSEGLITYVNSAFEKVTGYQRSEAIGKTPAILKSDYHDTAFYRQLWNTIHAGEVFEADFVNVKKDGALYYDSKKIMPILDEQGYVTHFVSLTKVAIA